MDLFTCDIHSVVYLNPEWMTNYARLIHFDVSKSVSSNR
ncbi:hypothetical protein F383_05792 [Gossypium arboreum]|uniref:Uncharacterized protein n=1 Tax=Gossypium arboreum TaxID=29729 RepID=A0A0B0PFQ9_GOSAR|nr:hypothetical protein F383_05792 [Gossypium arboreum]